jgi:hypothetical protein
MSNTENSWDIPSTILAILSLLFILGGLFGIAMFLTEALKTKQVDVVVVDKYEGLKNGTTTFFVETCLKNNIKRCELDTFSRRDYDMINIGEQWTLEVRDHEY